MSHVRTSPIQISYGLTNSSYYSGRASTQKMQITPATQEVVGRQNVRKAVAEAQRHGIINIYNNEENIGSNITYRRTKSPRPHPSTAHNGDATTTGSNLRTAQNDR